MDPSLERTFKGHKNYVTSVAFSPSIKQIASGAGDNTIMLWNFKPQMRAFRFIGHKGVVTDVQFSPDGDILASASKDKTVRLWVPGPKGESVTLKGHTGAVRSVSFSSDSRHLLTSSDDKTAKLWSLPSRKFLCSLVGHSNWVRSSCINATSDIVATGSDDKLVKLWDVATHQCLHTFHDHTDVVNKVAFHTDGGCIASGSADKSVKMWDIRSHQLIQHYPAHTEGVTSIAMHPSGYYLLSASKDSSLKIWDLREGRLVYTLQGHAGPVNASVFSHDGNFFVSGGADQQVMVWKTHMVDGLPVETDWTVSNASRPRTAPPVDVYQPIDLSATAYVASLAANGSTVANSSPIARPASAPAQPSPSTSSLFAVRRVPEALLSAGAAPSGASASTSNRPHSAANIRSPVLSNRSKVVLAGTKPSYSQTRQQQQAQAPIATSTETVENADVNGSYFASPVRSTGKIASRAPAPARASEPVASPAVIQREQVPEALSNTLDHIVSQLDIMTRTMTILEQRLSVTEDRVSSVIAFTRDMLSAQKQQAQPTSSAQPRQQQPAPSSTSVGSPERTSVTVQPSSPLVSASSIIHRINNINADNESRGLVAEALLKVSQPTTSSADDESQQDPIVAGEFDGDSEDDYESDGVGNGDRGNNGEYAMWHAPVDAEHYDEDDDSERYTEVYENETEDE